MQSEQDAGEIARKLTRDQWLVLLGPRNFGPADRGIGPLQQRLMKLGLIERGPTQIWPLTALGRDVVEARSRLQRSDLGQRARVAYEKNVDARATAPLSKLNKMSDPWDDVVAAIYNEIYETVRAQFVATQIQNKGQDDD